MFMKRKKHKNLREETLEEEDVFRGETFSKFGEGKEQRVEKVLSIRESSGCT